MTDPQSGTLDVGRRDLADAARTLAKASKGAPKGDVTLAHVHGELVLESPGVSVAIPASGGWTAVAHLDSSFASNLARMIPSTDRVTLKAEPAHLVIGSTSLPCRWMTGRKAGVDVALNDQEPDLLRAARTYSPAEIASAGLTEPIERAEQWLLARLNQATAALGDVGVT